MPPWSGRGYLAVTHGSRKDTPDAEVRLTDRPELLLAMLAGQSKQQTLYKPGPYWMDKSRNAVNEIRKHGISRFRGADNAIGWSYSDALHMDTRHGCRYGIRWLVYHLARLYPLSKLFDWQVGLTAHYARQMVALQERLLQDSPRVSELLDRYSLPYSLLGGCVSKAKIGDREMSIHYLDQLDQHDRLATELAFGRVRSVIEIGGGFGCNIHLLLHNYQNIRKVVYLDIPPNLYVGTQYLRAFFGEAVRDFGETERLTEIGFSPNDSREILCICPWQIERLRVSCDLLINAHSFVEMPEKVVHNYIAHVMRWDGAERMAVALSSYGEFDSATTIPPDSLCAFFETRRFIAQTHKSLVYPGKSNHFWISAPSA